MRDPHFIAVHRGGLLELSQHRLLSAWAADCAEHVLQLYTESYPDDLRVAQAIQTARAWARGETTVGKAHKASVEAHATARSSIGAAHWVARAAGHAVATAHAADHAFGAALYAVKAIELANGLEAANRERNWQQGQLPAGIQEVVTLAANTKKFHSFNIANLRRKVV